MDFELMGGLKSLNCTGYVAQEYQGLKANLNKLKMLLFILPPPLHQHWHFATFQFQKLDNCTIRRLLVNSRKVWLVHQLTLESFGPFISMGDVKAVLMGHDHENDFCGNLDGIWFCYGGGFGYHAYGMEGWPRIVRIIMERGFGEEYERIKTWKRIDDDKMSMTDEQVSWMNTP
ncbi:hypothetical protein RJ641_025687 [Dillenia turbinata]|uniref:Calcineurin-like phosphoesterase domain-containing protein n=1 Tax=Dillenia turbinata TaxID=194707 RepID=A0AAN8W238_9MAGN